MDRGLLSKTGIPEKNEGDRIYHSEINKMNGTINSIVDEINKNMKSFINVNLDCLGGNLEKGLTLKEAINLIDPTRRTPGMIIKFLNSDKTWIEYEYFSTSLSDWFNLDYWRKVGEIILLDGGTF